ncbi:hypothetical protein EC957_003048 [Mortierella hygrophila]|uniref:Uncharacterized protein n=1 Tax=Mortierella hygrophila TaxID=979708 RepID=A0A9P6F3I2_9FUNG|nr:hypothetical protein EC957_003048 [Mortierella hygrophila]
MGQYYQLINLDKHQSFDTLGLLTFLTGLKMGEKLEDMGEKPLLALALTHLSFPAAVTADGDAEVEAVENPMTPVGSWSGDRIAIIGDYSEGFPPFFTSQDQQVYKAYTAKLAEENGQTGGKDGQEFVSIYSYACNTYASISVRDFFEVDSLDDQFEAQFPKLDETHHLILNLDKNEYLDPIVCKSPTQEKEEGVGVVATFVVEFAQQKDGIMQGLFSLLFYSNGSGGGDVDRFREGRWAGDRISIQVKETVGDLVEWKDISVEVEADLNASGLRTKQ